MTNEEKLKKIKEFLKENNLWYYRGHDNTCNAIPDIYVPKFRIMVKLSEGKEKDDEFYLKIKYTFRPLFIRETETAEFVLEKMQNLIIRVMTEQQRNYKRKHPQKIIRKKKKEKQRTKSRR